MSHRKIKHTLCMPLICTRMGRRIPITTGQIPSVRNLRSPWKVLNQSKNISTQITKQTWCEMRMTLRKLLQLEFQTILQTVVSARKNKVHFTSSIWEINGKVDWNSQRSRRKTQSKLRMSCTSHTDRADAHALVLIILCSMHKECTTNICKDSIRVQQSSWSWV